MPARSQLQLKHPKIAPCWRQFQLFHRGAPKSKVLALCCPRNRSKPCKRPMLTRRNLLHKFACCAISSVLPQEHKNPVETSGEPPFSNNRIRGYGQREFAVLGFSRLKLRVAVTASRASCEIAPRCIRSTDLRHVASGKLVEYATRLAVIG